MDFKDGSTVICNDVALASGGNTATCQTSTLGAGDHSMTAEYSGTTGAAPRFAASTSSALLQDVNKRSVTASITAAGKTYDGNTDAEITDCSLNAFSGNVGKVPTDDVDCEATNGAFDTASAGPGKQVSADVSLTGTAAGNYELSSNTASTNADIDKADGSVSINNLPSNATVGGSFTPTYDKAGDGTPSTTSNSTSICTVSSSGVVNFVAAGTCKLQASVTEGTNHNEATGAEQTFTIAAATPMFNFTGFFSPIDNKDNTTGHYVLNSVKAGSAVPVKFSLGGDKGLNIFATATDGTKYPKSSVISCDPTAQVDAVESTVTAGQSTLQYDATRDQYTYVWKTEKSSTGCRQLEVKLTDGSSYRASFKFTK